MRLRLGLGQLARSRLARVHPPTSTLRPIDKADTPPQIAKMVQRVTYRRNNPYNTKSNRTRVIKTPGGKTRLLHIKKPGTVPKCGDCGSKLSGVSGSNFDIASHGKQQWHRLRLEGCGQWGRRWRFKPATTHAVAPLRVSIAANTHTPCARQHPLSLLTHHPADPRPPPPRVRPGVEAHEDGPARVRRFPVRQLRARQDRARLPH
jgi:ribosomal protein L34E